MAIKKDKSLSAAAELRRLAEERLAEKTVKSHPRTAAETQRLFHELEVHQTELEMQNAELRQAQEDLEMSRNRYAELYDFAPSGYFTFDRHGLIREVNLTGAQLLGIERGLLADKPFTRFIADADGRDVFSHHLEAVLQRQGMKRCEIRLTGNAGTVIYGQLQSIMVDTSESNGGYILSSIVDCTVSKQAEETLLQAGALQSAIFNSVNFSSIATDANGVIQIFNVGAERMLGYAAIDVMNKITPADISDPQEVIARAEELTIELETQIKPGFEALVFKASRGIEDIYELTYIRKDGSRFPAVVSVTALRDEQETIIGYLLIGTDNTVRKQIESDRQQLAQRLRDHQFYTRTLFECNIDAIMTTDPDGIITDVNKQMGLLTDCTRDELIGSPFKIYFTDQVLAEASINLVLSKKTVTNYELTARARDGKETMVSFNATTFYDRDRKLQGMFAAARDVTERNILDKVLKEKNVELEAVNKEMEDFSYSVSHDLRAPLHAIDGFSRKMLVGYGERLDDEGRRLLQVVRDNAQRMEKLIDDLLAFSRMGRREIILQPLDMDAMVNGVIEELRAAEPDRSIEFALSPLPRTRGDVAMMRQVWVNLLGNAVKFTSKRQTAHIEVGCREEGGELHYWVRDDGAGFDMQYAEKLFGVFQRLHRQDEFEGTGVGLAIVQRILHRHNGHIWGEGKPDEGATLHFALPMPSPDKQPSGGDVS